VKRIIITESILANPNSNFLTFLMNCCIRIVKRLLCSKIKLWSKKWLKKTRPFKSALTPNAEANFPAMRLFLNALSAVNYWIYNTIGIRKFLRFHRKRT
jgi:hypothetical protein